MRHWACDPRQSLRCAELLRRLSTGAGENPGARTARVRDRADRVRAAPVVLRVLDAPARCAAWPDWNCGRRSRTVSTRHGRLACRSVSAAIEFMLLAAREGLRFASELISISRAPAPGLIGLVRRSKPCGAFAKPTVLAPRWVITARQGVFQSVRLRTSRALAQPLRGAASPPAHRHSAT